MKRHSLLALGLALSLAGVGAWAIAPSNGAGNAAATPPAQPGDTVPSTGTDRPTPDNPPGQNPAAGDTAPALPAPANPAPAVPPAVNPAAPDAGQPAPTPPDAGQVNPAQPNPAPPGTVTPVPANPDTPNSAPPRPGAAPGPNAGAMAMAASPLREFVGHQVGEIGSLSQQMDQFRMAKRPEVVLAMYHMIRDHRLVADAAQNVLARRGDVSRPLYMPMDNMAQTPEEILRQQIQHHEEELNQTQQLLSQANTPEERSIYQQTVTAVNRHLTWLRAAEQGQPLQIGFFGPTTPLSRIAGYREEARLQQAAANNGRIRSNRAARHRRARRGRYHGMRSSRAGYR